MLHFERSYCQKSGRGGGQMPSQNWRHWLGSYSIYNSNELRNCTPVCWLIWFTLKTNKFPIFEEWVKGPSHKIHQNSKSSSFRQIQSTYKHNSLSQIGFKQNISDEDPARTWCLKNLVFWLRASWNPVQFNKKQESFWICKRMIFSSSSFHYVS